MKRIYMALVLSICAGVPGVVSMARAQSVAAASCATYKDASDGAQQALYMAYLQGYANASSPDPRYTQSDAALADDAKKIRDWCGKNSKRTYGEAVSAILGSASSSAAPAAAQAPPPPQEPTSCKVTATRGCPGCAVTCNGGKQATCRQGQDSGIKDDQGNPECAMQPWCYCGKK
jgi:hypothetical protein